MDYFSTGKIEFQEWGVSFQWTIPFFGRWLENINFQQSLWSPQFSASLEDGPTWCLTLGECTENDEFLQLGFYKIASNETVTFDVEFRLRILDKEREEVVTTSGTLSSKMTVGTHQRIHRFVRKDFVLNEANCVLDDESGMLTIHCSFDQSSAKFQNFDDSLPNDYGSMFDSQEYGDVTIVVDGKEFLAYKGILAARSPVFAAMFKHELEERKQSRVTIEDTEPDVVREMLTYIYTGQSPNIETMALGLLAVADKYDLERLKRMSEEVLCRITSLSVENVADTLILAELHNAKRLRKRAIRYITSHATQLMIAPEWKNDILKSLCKHPDLIHEIFHALAIKPL